MVGVRGRILSRRRARRQRPATRDYAELDRFPAHDPLEALRSLLPDATSHAELPVSLASGRGLPRLRGRGALGAAAGARRPTRSACPRPSSTCPTCSSSSTTWPRPPPWPRSTGPGAEERLADIADRLARPVRRRGRPRSSRAQPSRPGAAGGRRRATRPAWPAWSRDIRAGEMLQAVLARRFSHALPGRAAGGLPRAAAHQPLAAPVRGRPRARALDAGRLAGAARARARRRSSPRGPSRARGRAPPTRCATGSWRTTCWPTRRSSPSTPCSWTSPATTSAAWPCRAA